MTDRLRDVFDKDEANFLRLVLDSVSDCLVVCDGSGEILLINRPYAGLLGGSPDEFVGRHVRDAVSPHSHLAEVAQGAAPVVGETLSVRGRRIVIKQVPIVVDGDIVGALGIALFANTHAAETTLKRLVGEALVIPSEAGGWRARYGIDDIIGRGPEIGALKADIRRAARADLPLLVRGETGTGKELVAHAVHRLSSRSTAPFVTMNCATIPPELIASELFGYQGGAFTGARSSGSKGKLQLAHRGTLFLDEIGDMPVHAQAALLRFLQEGEIVPVGGSQPVIVDTRIISASHKNLESLVESGDFREDLLYRLRVLEVEVPALRQRSDLDLLVSHLLARVCGQLGLTRLAIGRQARAQLHRYHWPGNVRELLATLQRAAARLSDDEFEITDLPELERRMKTSYTLGEPALPMYVHRQPTSLAAAVREAERESIEAALSASGGNRAGAARILGIDRTSLYKRLKTYGIAR